MINPIIDQEHFQDIDFTETKMAKGDYENCTFTNCNFQYVDLSSITFLECRFESCNLSNAILKNTGLKTVSFKQCKMLGIVLSECNTFLLSLHFEHCVLNLSSFFKLKLKGIKFIHCNLQEVDFTSADLTNAHFEECDLLGATFDGSILEKADFRTAVNYTFDPEKNKIKKARFSIPSVTGLLQKYDIRIE